MEREDAIPAAQIGANTKPATRLLRWKRRNPIELNGKSGRNYMHKFSPLLRRSYAEGTYLASVTRSGCLTLHDFESLYGQCNESGQGKDEKKPLLHLSLYDGSIFHDFAGAVRWNPSNQDEIAYTSSLYNDHKLTIFDIEHTRANQCHDMLNRILASDTSGSISMWDRRVSDLPQRVLTTTKRIGSFASIQLLGDQCVYGATKGGLIYIWDLRRLRAGRSSACQSGTEVHSSPLTWVNLESMLQAQGNFRLMEIQSININPTCPYQLGFHIGDGWSGVLDMHNLRVSHVHSPPPPPPLDRWYTKDFSIVPPRKPSWLNEHSIYVAASASSHGLHLIDFYPHPSSPCHVDYGDSRNPGESVECKQSVFVPLSKRATACATHPLNGTIVAGTMNASLLVISQKNLCKKGDGDDDDDDGHS
ncbi:hypothetical protein SSX86_018686 [Deinandra increscens subsp. villosa]|uniref:Transducin/WD40 repeat-like superfamily protein n=1 Tax=Deinandra increscens subsp. villosa TaxID=3103831 RepID=A0AAP0CRC3_9ASTR